MIVGNEYVRIEVVGQRGADGSGCGNNFSREMVECELLPTPPEVKYNDQHWFTPLGYEKVGKAIIKSAEKKKIPIEVKRMKTHEILKHNITYRDEFQVTVSRFIRSEI